MSHLVFIPLIVFSIASPTPLGHGVAWAATSPPTAALNADWWYWQFPCAWPCAHAVPDWQAPETCSDVIVLGNEPDGQTPYAPEWAAAQSQTIRAACPAAYVIAGNTTQANAAWLVDYLAAGGVADRLGTHCYNFAGDETCAARLADFRATFPGRALCLTEWNYLSVTLDPAAFGAYLDYVLANWDCSAVFTERYTGVYWAWGPHYWLVEAGGELNAAGEAFAAR